MKTHQRGTNNASKPPSLAKVVALNPKGAHPDVSRGADGHKHCPCGGECPRCASAFRRVMSTSGSALPNAVGESLGRRFGADLSQVRLHTGPLAAAATAEVGARRAFAVGNRVVIGQRGFTPGTSEGLKLLAHEIVHVLQQGGASPPGSWRNDEAPGLEREARRVAETVVSEPTRPIQRVRRSSAARGLVQRDEPAWQRPWTSQGEFQLHLDPEIEAMAARYYFRQWLSGQVGVTPTPAASASSPTTTPTSDSTTPPQEAEPTPAPLPSDWLGPSRLGAENLDWGSLMTPYFQRGLLPNASGDTRDLDVMRGLFLDRYRFVSLLPDLRAMAPSFARPWIPTEWRTRLAETLTSTTVDFALSRDHPTVFELSNQAWERFTGATTYSLPMVSVPYLSDWWNRFSGGSIGPTRSP